MRCGSPQSLNELSPIIVKVLVAQSCLTLCDPMDRSPSDSSVHGILQARILEWAAIPFSRGSLPSWDWTCISCIVRLLLYHWATQEAGSSNRRPKRTNKKHSCCWEYVCIQAQKYLYWVYLKLKGKDRSPEVSSRNDPQHPLICWCLLLPNSNMVAGKRVNRERYF